MTNPIINKMKKITLFLLVSILTLSASSFDNKEGTRTLYASQCGASLNSDVFAGGGTDDTQILQALLDSAPKMGRLHLIIDGAALVSKTLVVHSNTTIECPDKSCGLFLADSSNCRMIINAKRDRRVIYDRNISLIGGVYNQNAKGQRRGAGGNVINFEGIEYLNMRDLTVANQRGWGMSITNWRYVNMDNIHIDPRDRFVSSNQDGIHFHGPGRFLTMRNIYGSAGDDFIALAPDEINAAEKSRGRRDKNDNDTTLTITDVLIDGVQVDNADQVIRLLVCDAGYLDRIVIRNVTGTYNSYGFIINPWDWETGRFGNMVFDMIDLRPLKNTYSYAYPFLFKLGGHIESLTVKNLYHHLPDFDHSLFIVGGHYTADRPAPEGKESVIDRLIIDGMYIYEENIKSIPETYFRIKSKVGILSIKDVIHRRADGLPKTGSLILLDGGSIDELMLNNISAPALQTIR